MCTPKGKILFFNASGNTTKINGNTLNSSAARDDHGFGFGFKQPDLSIFFGFGLGFGFKFLGYGFGFGFILI